MWKIKYSPLADTPLSMAGAIAYLNEAPLEYETQEEAEEDAFANLYEELEARFIWDEDLAILANSLGYRFGEIDSLDLLVEACYMVEYEARQI